jgi:hypothetical protein
MLLEIKRPTARQKLNSPEFLGLNSPIDHLQTGTTSFTFNLGAAIRLQTAVSWSPGAKGILQNDCFAH